MKIKKIVLQFFIFILFLGAALFVSPQKVSACSWSGCSSSYPGYYYTYSQTCTSTPACTMGSGDCGWPAWPGNYFCANICGTFTYQESACSSSCLAGTKTTGWYNQCGANPDGQPPQTVACGPLCSPVTCAGYSYGSWGACSSTCGETGTQSRPRYYACNGGAAGTDSTTCYECDSWGCAGTTYGSWGSCSVSCGGGTQTRTATDNCSGTSACGHGATCSQACNTQACNAAPGAPSVSSPSNGATGVSRTPAISLASTDTNGDYIRYKIQIATDAGFTANVQTFDQTASQTGWSGQNADESRAYTSGATATYTVQTALSQNLLYYLRAYAIDPGGSATWSTASTSISFTTISSPPSTPSLDLPANGATNQSLTSLVLKTTTTDPNSDYLRYKIEMCTDAAMTTGCQTFTQPTGSPQTGWSGQNAQTNTAYTSGTQGVYTIQSVLPFSTTYYWRSYAIDPGGSNAWSSTQGTPYSFTTSAPNIASLDSPANAAINVLPNFTFKTTASDPENDYLVYKIQACTNAAMTTSCQLFDQTASAVGWTGQSTNSIDIIDSYTDSTKINTGSSTNQQVTGGQLKMYDLALCPTHGICQTGGSYANGNCVAVVNVAAGQDTNNDCTASYNACSGNNRIGPDGNCDGAGACNTTGQSSACTIASACQTGGGCSAGNCVAPSNASAGTDPNNYCPSYNCTNKAYGWSGNNCLTAAALSGDGMCNGSGACYGFVNSCTTGAGYIAICDSSSCINYGSCIQGLSLIDTGTGADGAVTISTNKNINTDPIKTGRTAADGEAFAVSAISTNTVTLTGTGTDGTAATSASTSIAASDEVLLINLQGDSTNYDNVGNFETLTVQSVSSSTITFTRNISNTYGVGGNSNLTGQKIMVQRVPNYTTVNINSASLTANAWDGTKGGVLFFRATSVTTVTGTITMSGKGYSASYQGTSYSGTGTSSPSGFGPNNGGGGGLGGNNSPDTAGSGGGGGGYGAAGANGGCGAGNCTIGQGGISYGSNTLSKLYLGSAGGGGGSAGDGYPGGPGGAGGGIIAIYADSINLSNSGSNLISNGNVGSVAGSCCSGGGGGGSGGSILLKGNGISLTNILSFTATGGNGGNGGSAGGGNGAVGRIAMYYNHTLNEFTSNPTAYYTNQYKPQTCYTDNLPHGSCSSPSFCDNSSNCVTPTPIPPTPTPTPAIICAYKSSYSYCSNICPNNYGLPCLGTYSDASCSTYYADCSNYSRYRYCKCGVATTSCIAGYYIDYQYPYTCTDRCAAIGKTCATSYGYSDSGCTSIYSYCTDYNYYCKCQ